MRDIPIVDPHMHLWDLKRIRYPWLTPPLGPSVAGDLSTIARDYRIDDYLADANGWTVAKVVHVDAGAHPEEALNETRWLQETSDAKSYPNGIVAFAALDAKDAERVLAAQADHRNVRGIRHILNWHRDPSKSYTPRNLLQDDQWKRGYALLRKFNLSFDLQIYPGQMEDAARVAAEHPDTQVILNHAGMPVDRDDDGLALWRKGMAALAAQPNVAVKISGLAMMDWDWTPERIRPFVLHTIELFGADRAMFASNFPVDRIHGSFSKYFDAYHQLVADFTLAEKRKLFGENAERIYRLR
jgi:predicted TIM-barrel fold metal-dependent hydrolase